MTGCYRYEVLLPLPYHDTYTYSFEYPLELGTIVTVSFGKRELSGMIWEYTDPAYQPKFTIKPIMHIWDLPPIPEPSRKLIAWASQYYMSNLGSCLKMLLTGLPDKDYKPRKQYGYFSALKDCPREFPLTEDQLLAAGHVQNAIESRIFQTFLLDGVTGSGKTEVYYEALLSAIRNEKQVLILLPEITLTQQWLERFKTRFGVLPARWHSSLKQTERRHTWQQILKGNAPVVVGARSGLFLPFKQLGLIVVDEEHDASYKQEEGVHYHGRDLAVIRARFESCPLVLASATPSIESYENTLEGKYTLLSLRQRFGSAGSPEVHVVNLCQRSERTGKAQYLSKTLGLGLKATLARKEQAIIFLNRRGFAPITLCTECGYKVMCQECSTYLVDHRPDAHRHILQCHQCGFKTTIPKECPECGVLDSFYEWGVGIDRLKEEVQDKFPDARILTVSSDHMTHQDDLDHLYHALHQHTVDIVLGTQIMAKGHDFSNVTFVGIIDADTGLMHQDIRSAEITYQLLHQVAGRCGRGDKPGHVYIQTFTPEHPVIQALKEFNRDGFLSLELQNRKMAALPPFSRQIAIIISGPKEEEVKRICGHMYNKLPLSQDIFVFGPAPAPLAKLRNQYRYRFLIQGPKHKLLQPFVHEWLHHLKLPSKIKITIDVDPVSFF